jgi:hypothetical protein
MMRLFLRVRAAKPNIGKMIRLAVKLTPKPIITLIQASTKLPNLDCPVIAFRLSFAKAKDKHATAHGVSYVR